MDSRISLELDLEAYEHFVVSIFTLRVRGELRDMFLDSDSQDMNARKHVHHLYLHVCAISKFARPR